MFENFDEWAKAVIGRTEKEITDAVIEAGGEVRVVERDGTYPPITRDVHPNRANLVVVDGIVTKITFG